jgi:allantoate deiminase
MPKILTQRLADLAAASDSPDGLTRLFLSPAHGKAVAMVEHWMRMAGLTTHRDAIGNLVGRTEISGPVLMLGSHIDTVRDAGWYDGNFGVLAAIAALEQLRAAGEILPFGVEVIAFGDEEGVRFPQTLSGARAVAGTFDPVALAGLDEDGISMAAALSAFGGNPENISKVARKRDEVLGYVELHIEQGPVLEAHDLPVGIVTAINGASRFSVTVTGKASHAGTVPMPMRRDALAGASAMVLAIESIGSATSDLVATVGALRVHPGAPNSIAGRVVFSIDIRAPEDAPRRNAVASVMAALRQIADARGVAIEIQQTHDAPATECAPRLRMQLASAVEACGITPLYLPSGAGHDAMAVAALCPVAMLFVRCKGGISHAPEEFLAPTDAQIAVSVLVQFLRHFQTI